MEEGTLQGEELNSELTGLNKGEKEQKKKLFIIGGILTALFIIILVIIIVVIASGSKGSNDDNQTLPSIGEIICVYYVESSNKNTILLGNDFQKNSDFDIFIDGTKIKYTKEYRFESAGNHNVQIKLYNNINMDYMFKDVQEIVSVEMISDKNCTILSMISTFENCNYLTFNYNTPYTY